MSSKEYSFKTTCELLEGCFGVCCLQLTLNETVYVVKDQRIIKWGLYHYTTQPVRAFSSTSGPPIYTTILVYSHIVK